MRKRKTTKRGESKIKLPKPSLVNTKSSKKIPISKAKLDQMRELENEHIIFSFRFLELNHEAFNLGGTCSRWSNDVFTLFNEMSTITRNDFVNTLKKKYRSHIHQWENLEYKYSLDDGFLDQVECRQARISTSKGGIHGFLIGNHFYVVWLDPHHNLYPDNRYGGLKKYNPPETCCSERDSVVGELRLKVEEYEEILEEYTSPDYNINQD